MMKIAGPVVLGLLTVVIGLAPIAHAAPFEPHDLASNEVGEKEFGKGEKGNGWKGQIKHFLSGNPAKNGNKDLGGTVIGGTNYVQSSAPVNSVAVPGTFLLFGVGFVALTLWYQCSRRRVSAVDSAR